jgi:hypothetical protein
VAARFLRAPATNCFISGSSHCGLISALCAPAGAESPRAATATVIVQCAAANIDRYARDESDRPFARLPCATSTSFHESNNTFANDIGETPANSRDGQRNQPASPGIAVFRPPRCMIADQAITSWGIGVGTGALAGHWLRSSNTLSTGSIRMTGMVAPVPSFGAR